MSNTTPPTEPPAPAPATETPAPASQKHKASGTDAAVKAKKREDEDEDAAKEKKMKTQAPAPRRWRQIPREFDPETPVVEMDNARPTRLSERVKLARPGRERAKYGK